MTAEDFQFLADHVATIDGQRPQRLDEVHDRIRVARRRRTVGAVGGVAAFAAAAVAVAVIVPGSGQHSSPSVNQPTFPTVEPIEEPAGQTDLPIDIGPNDIVRDLESFASAANEPGETELHVSLPFGETYYPEIAGYCRASSDIWWVANGNYGQCSPDAALEGTPSNEFEPIGNAPMDLAPPGSNLDQETSVDMWLTGPLSQPARNCIVHKPAFTGFDTEECLSKHDVTKVSSADGAEFGVTAYRHRAPLVIKPFKDGFEALARLGGSDYVVSRAVTSSPGADTLAAYLPVSEQPRLIFIAPERNCDGIPHLFVDGERVTLDLGVAPGAPSPWYWTRQEICARALVPPGSHNVTFDLPNQQGAALLVYQAQPQE